MIRLTQILESKSGWKWILSSSDKNYTYIEFQTVDIFREYSKILIKRGLTIKADQRKRLIGIHTYDLVVNILK